MPRYDRASRVKNTMNNIAESDMIRFPSESIIKEIMALDLRHYSGKPIKQLGKTSPYRPHHQSKPDRGLWISVEGNGDGWKQWCTDQDFYLDNLVYEHQVILKHDARILWITNSAQLRSFTKEFVADSELNIAKLTMAIDWLAVAKVYQGVIITPYLWSCRLDPATLWYYGWDCASGCIWDTAAIAEIKLISDL